MSALLMAILLNGMTAAEIARWTAAMIDSGERLDLSATSAGRPVDKHSTGGVGDKISLPLAPLVAACGAAVPQLSGRGLGHTGGTLDKMESIPGWRARRCPRTRSPASSRDVGAVICAASPTLAPGRPQAVRAARRHRHRRVDPADRRSIMSKKIAEGTAALVLDVKVGLRRVHEDARSTPRELARTMVDTRRGARVRTTARCSPTCPPRWAARSATRSRWPSRSRCCAGGGPADVVELTLALAREMLALAGLDADPADGAGVGRGDGPLAGDGRRAGRRPGRAAAGGRRTSRSCGPTGPACSSGWTRWRSAWPPGGWAPAGPARSTRCRPRPGIRLLAEPGDAGRGRSAAVRAAHRHPGRRRRARSPRCAAGSSSATARRRRARR